MKALITGWFSYKEMGATAGDLHVRDVVAKWLGQSGFPYDIAVETPFTNGVDWRSVNPKEYTHLLFVCGPFGQNDATRELLAKFAHCKTVGVNLSMLKPLSEWNPFEFLLERDSDNASRPDLSLLSERPLVPVVGMVLVKPQEEYGMLGRHREAKKALYRVTEQRECSVVLIDTRLDVNMTGLRNSAEVESVIARMDLVLTTRLHGTVLALKNGVPSLTIDPILDGAKIRAQCATLGWPLCFDVEELDQEALVSAYDWALTQDAKTKALACAKKATASLGNVARQFLDYFQTTPQPATKD